MLTLIKGFFTGGNLTGYFVVAILILSGLFFGYWKYANGKMADDENQIASYKVAVGEQTKTIKQLNDDIAKVAEINATITAKNAANTQQALKLSNTLNKLSPAIDKNSKMVEDLINKASQDRIRCLEIASGSPVQKNEKNSVCPQFLKN